MKLTTIKTTYIVIKRTKHICVRGIIPWQDIIWIVRNCLVHHLPLLLRQHKLRSLRVNIKNIGREENQKTAYKNALQHYERTSSGKENPFLFNFKQQSGILKKGLETVKLKYVRARSPSSDSDRAASPAGNISPDRGASPDPLSSPDKLSSPVHRKSTASKVFTDSDSDEEDKRKKERAKVKEKERKKDRDKGKDRKEKDRSKEKLINRPKEKDSREREEDLRNSEVRRPKGNKSNSDPNRFKIPKVGRTNENKQTMKSILEEGLKKVSSSPSNSYNKYHDYRKEQRLKEIRMKRDRDNVIDIKKVR